MKPVLCRCDQGSGGWSLHAPGTTDEQIANGEGLLASGTAHRIGSDWSRPDKADYARAESLMRGE